MDKNIIPRHQPRAPQAIARDTEQEALDPRQALALREWMRLSQDGHPARRQAFRPERIAKALPVSTLVCVDWDGDRPSFRQRIEGKMVRIAFGETRGQSFNETFAPYHLAQSLPAFSEAVREGHVTLTTVAAKTSGGAAFNFTRLLLPFTDETGRVVRVLAVYGFDVNRLMNLRAPLEMTADASDPEPRRSQRAYLRLKTA